MMQENRWTPIAESCLTTAAAGVERFHDAKRTFDPDDILTPGYQVF